MLFCLNFFSGLLLLIINAIITLEAVNDNSINPVSVLGKSEVERFTVTGFLHIG